MKCTLSQIPTNCDHISDNDPIFLLTYNNDFVKIKPKTKRINLRYSFFVPDTHLITHHGGDVPQRRDGSGPTVHPARSRLSIHLRIGRNRNCTIQRCECIFILFIFFNFICINQILSKSKKMHKIVTVKRGSQCVPKKICH